MTNQIAIILGVLILLAIVIDVALMEGSNSLFLAKKFTKLIEWMAFWR